MLVNPISFRLSVSIFWNSTWNLYKNGNYKYLFYSDLVFFEFFMFFFRKTLGGSYFDYYSSHIRLYRLQDKIIINLYYHMAKDEYYFDDVDLIYKGFKHNNVYLNENLLQNKNLLEEKKKLKKVKLVLFLNKIIELIEQNLIKSIFCKLIWYKKLDLNIKLNLQNIINFKWFSLKKIIEKKINIITDLQQKLIIKKILKKYYFKLGQNYIDFFLDNNDLIFDYKKKKKKKKKYIYIKKYNENLMDLINLNFQSSKKKKKKLFVKEKVVSNNNNLLFNKVKYLKFLNIYNYCYGIGFLKKMQKISLNKKKKIKKIWNQKSLRNIIEDIMKQKKKYEENSIEITEKEDIEYDINFNKKKKLLKKNNRKKKNLNIFFFNIKKINTNELKVLKKIKKSLFIKIKNKSKKKNNKNFFINKKEKKIKNKNLDFLIENTKNIFYKSKIYKKINKIHNNILNIKKKFKVKYQIKQIFYILKKKMKNILRKKIKKKINKKKNKKLKQIIYKIINKNKKKKKIKIKKESKIKKINSRLKNYDFYFLYKINFLKFIYNQKLWLYNLYYYFLSKFLKKESKKFFFKFLKKIELNIFKINSNAIRASIISKYINSSFKHNYSVYETMRPVLTDLKQRMKNKKVAGFKITISGRFKRAQRATYWWRKDGDLLTGTQTSGLDYNTSLHKTKYGVCTISVWLTPGIKGLGELIYEYPTINPFFFLLKKDKLLKIDYFLLKRNNLFFINLLKKGQILSYSLEKNYVKGLILCMLYKYIYINIFLKNMFIKNILKKVNKNIKRIFLPQYCIYKIHLEDYLQKNYIKIIPFIQIKLLKRLNLRNSYKINFLNKSKFVDLKIFKYRIFLN